MGFYAQIDDSAIELGRRRQRGHCAIAYAIAKRHPEARHINVDREEIRLTDSHDRVRFCYETPPSAVDFIDRWDAGEQVEPFILRLLPKLMKWEKPATARSAQELVKPLMVNTEIVPAQRKPRDVSAKSIATRPLVTVSD